jgi:polysaccharide biosynthesis transport protein
VASANRHVSPTDGTIVPSLLDYLRVVGRWKLVFLLIVLLVPATAVAVSLSQTPTYRASADVLLDPAADTGGQAVFIDPQRVAQTQAVLARVPEVADAVLEDVPSADLDRKEFLESSTVSTTLGSDVLTFSVENSDPQLAMELATGYANAFTEYRQGLETVHAPSAEVVRTADEAPKVGPRTVRNGLIALCLGLVIALIIVFLADALDTRVRSVDSIREALGLPLLGRLPTPPSRQRKGNGLVMLADPTSHEAEPYRVLRTSLEFANADHSFRTIMITSAADAEGKSTTVANLAVTLARAGRRVILIDADLSSPHLHRLFGLDEQPGLTDLALGDTRLEEALRPIGLKGEASEADHASRRMDRTGSLEVLPGGSTLQDKLGFENAVGRIIHRIRDRADIVLVGAPPLLMGDAIALSAHVDAVVVVARLKALRMSTLEDMSRILDASPATKLGFIVTGVDQSNPYRQHQRYAASERRAEEKPRLTLTVAPPAADGDGGVPAGERSDETANESETVGGGDQTAPSTPAHSRSKSAAKRFGGLTPSEAGKRSWEIRRAKSAQRADAPESAPLDAKQDVLKDS